MEWRQGDTEVAVFEDRLRSRIETGGVLMASLRDCEFLRLDKQDDEEEENDEQQQQQLLPRYLTFAHFVLKYAYGLNPRRKTDLACTTRLHKAYVAIQEAWSGANRREFIDAVDAVVSRFFFPWESVLAFAIFDSIQGVPPEVLQRSSLLQFIHNNDPSILHNVLRNVLDIITDLDRETMREALKRLPAPQRQAITEATHGMSRLTEFFVAMTYFVVMSGEVEGTSRTFHSMLAKLVFSEMSLPCQLPERDLRVTPATLREFRLIQADEDEDEDENGESSSCVFYTDNDQHWSSSPTKSLVSETSALAFCQSLLWVRNSFCPKNERLFSQSWSRVVSGAEGGAQGIGLQIFLLDAAIQVLDDALGSMASEDNQSAMLKMLKDATDVSMESARRAHSELRDGENKEKGDENTTTTTTGEGSFAYEMEEHAALAVRSLEEALGLVQTVLRWILKAKPHLLPYDNRQPNEGTDFFEMTMAPSPCPERRVLSSVAYFLASECLRPGTSSDDDSRGGGGLGSHRDRPESAEGHVGRITSYLLPQFSDEMDADNDDNDDDAQHQHQHHHSEDGQQDKLTPQEQHLLYLSPPQKSLSQLPPGLLAPHNYSRSEATKWWTEDSGNSNSGGGTTGGAPRHVSSWVHLRTHRVLDAEKLARVVVKLAVSALLFVVRGQVLAEYMATQQRGRMADISPEEALKVMKEISSIVMLERIFPGYVGVELDASRTTDAKLTGMFAEDGSTGTPRTLRIARAEMSVRGAILYDRAKSLAALCIAASTNPHQISEEQWDAEVHSTLSAIMFCLFPVFKDCQPQMQHPFYATARGPATCSSHHHHHHPVAVMANDRGREHVLYSSVVDIVRGIATITEMQLVGDLHSKPVHAPHADGIPVLMDAFTVEWVKYNTANGITPLQSLLITEETITRLSAASPRHCFLLKKLKLQLAHYKSLLGAIFRFDATDSALVPESVPFIHSCNEPFMHYSPVVPAGVPATSRRQRHAESGFGYSVSFNREQYESLSPEADNTRPYPITKKTFETLEKIMAMRDANYRPDRNLLATRPGDDTGRDKHKTKRSAPKKKEKKPPRQPQKRKRPDKTPPPETMEIEVPMPSI